MGYLPVDTVKMAVLIYGVIELNLEQHSYDILIYDNVPGGAGHVKRLVDRKDIVNALQAAHSKVASYVRTDICTQSRIKLFKEIERFIFVAFRVGRALSTYRDDIIP